MNLEKRLQKIEDLLDEIHNVLLNIKIGDSPGIAEARWAIREAVKGNRKPLDLICRKDGGKIFLEMNNDKRLDGRT
jgi:hypothetical protein